MTVQEEQVQLARGRVVRRCEEGWRAPTIYTVLSWLGYYNHVVLLEIDVRRSRGRVSRALGHGQVLCQGTLTPPGAQQ